LCAPNSQYFSSQCRHAFLPTKPPLTIASSKTTTLLTEFRPTLIGIRPIRALPGAVSCMLRSPRQHVLREKIQTDLKPKRAWFVPSNKQRRSLPFRTSRSSPKPPTHLKTRDPLRTFEALVNRMRIRLPGFRPRPNHDLPYGKYSAPDHKVLSQKTLGSCKKRQKPLPFSYRLSTLVHPTRGPGEGKLMARPRPHAAFFPFLLHVRMTCHPYHIFDWLLLTWKKLFLGATSALAFRTVQALTRFLAKRLHKIL
jgi:hypothetical protein